MQVSKNIQIYNAALRFLINMKPAGVDLERYFYGDHKDYQSMKEVFCQFIKTAQNYQRMPNVIAYERREAEIAKILYDYDIPRIAAMKEMDLYHQFRKAFNVTTPDSKYNSWYRWSCSVCDSARFLSSFSDTQSFDLFVRKFDSDLNTRVSLPLLIQKSIRGIGFALSCDLLKELGYTNYIKPDVHIMDVFSSLGLCERDPVETFKAASKMAEKCKMEDKTVTPYKVDKVFWLICSGYFYREKPEIRIEGQKQELIEYIKKELK